MHPIMSLIHGNHGLLKIPGGNLEGGREKDLRSLFLKKVLRIVKLRVKRIEDAQGTPGYLIIDQHIADMENL